MNQKYFKTVHLFVIGAAIGLLILGILAKFQMVTTVPSDQWYLPAILGVVFLIFEYLIQRKPK